MNPNYAINTEYFRNSKAKNPNDKQPYQSDKLFGAITLSLTSGVTAITAIIAYQTEPAAIILGIPAFIVSFIVFGIAFAWLLEDEDKTPTSAERQMKALKELYVSNSGSALFGYELLTFKHASSKVIYMDINPYTHQPLYRLNKTTDGKNVLSLSLSPAQTKAYEQYKQNECLPDKEIIKSVRSMIHVIEHEESLAVNNELKNVYARNNNPNDKPIHKALAEKRRALQLENEQIEMLLEEESKKFEQLKIDL